MNEYECKRCGRLIRKDKIDFCDECYKRNKRDLFHIQEIIANENVYDLATISKKSGVSIKIINMLAETEHIRFIN